MGASGDVIIVSLIDLGAGPAHIKEIVESVAPVTVDIERTMKKGISATRVHVSEIADKSETSAYPKIVADIMSSGLPDPITRDALTIFSRIASAESRVHGKRGRTPPPRTQAGRPHSRCGRRICRDPRSRAFRYLLRQDRCGHLILMNRKTRGLGHGSHRGSSRRPVRLACGSPPPGTC
ncbi:MAG: hypothetical protein C5S49_07820 [Candidatus Methanogaster sp.]|nr:MAG: hypothetical protein C5S49_07820 [ANME-2 cluster archaeon]